MPSVSGPVVAGETLIADLHGVRTIGFQGVLPSGSIAILGDRLFYLLALVCTRRLSERVTRHQQKRAGQKQEFRHRCLHGSAYLFAVARSEGRRAINAASMQNVPALICSSAASCRD
jgi:hypothetical protein